MADSNALTYDDLISAVAEKRFRDTGSVRRWLATAYADVWASADWSFKRVSRQTLYTTDDGTINGAAAAQPLMPTDFGEPTGLLDQYDTSLRLVSPDEFERQFSDTYAPAYGTPTVYTVVNRQIVLYPNPDSAMALQVSYRRRLAHKNTSGAVVGGYFTDGSDYPIWDDHHGILIPRAQALGLKSLNDPTWPPLQDEYDRQLELMISDYVPDYPTTWGRSEASVW